MRLSRRLPARYSASLRLAAMRAETESCWFRLVEVAVPQFSLLSSPRPCPSGPPSRSSSAPCPRAKQQHERRRHDRRQQQQHPRRHGQRRPVAAHPFPQHVAQRRRLRPHRLAALPPPQVVRQLRRRRVPPARLLLQTFQTDRLQIARRLRLQLPRRHRLVPRAPAASVSSVVGRLERRTAGQALVQDRPQRIHVASPARMSFDLPPACSGAM